MDLKKKFAEIKTKIKDNAPTIIATISTGVAIGVSVIAVINESNHVKFLAQAVEDMTKINDHLIRIKTQERLCISDETVQEVLDGSNDVWFDVQGNRFDVILHPEED